MLGFSLYFDRNYDIDQEILKHKNFDFLFTSIHYPVSADIFGRFIMLYEKAKAYDIKICADLNNEVLEKNPSLLDLDIIIRLDFGFSNKEIADLSQKNKICINASTIDKKTLEQIFYFGANPKNIIAIHNYYPLEFTALSKDLFVEKNKLLKSSSINLAAFIPGDENLRGPIYKSLPTVEYHRLKNPYIAYLDMKRNFGLDFVILAETVSSRILSYIENFENHGLVSLKATLDSSYENINSFKQRSDLSDFILRNERNYKKIKAQNPIFVEKGDILICNEKAGRYSGELEIAKKDLGLVENRNLIGKIDPSYFKILDYIKGGDEIVFDRG